MTRQRFGTWQDRMAWVICAVSVVLLTVPRPLRLHIAQPFQSILLAPRRLAVTVSRLMSDTRAENDRLSMLAAELAVDNARLRAVTGSWHEPAGYQVPLIRAPIIARDPATFERYLVISRGEMHGIRPGNPVVTPDGVAGKVISTGRHQAVVQTLFATDARIAVMSLRSRTPGVTRPAGSGTLSISYLPKEADYAAGDTVVTAGLGEVFPKGLQVGTVLSVTDDEEALFKPVLVRPFVQVTRLEAVYVLLLPESPLFSGPESIPSESAQDRRRTDWIENVAPAEIQLPADGDIP